ncbi:MAG: hypothetical protein C4548_15320 [Desulfobacteraceae bacterium]|jgi:hypothetical protein|nr:MAG: hypothetical protein C4548_15320 [Desulfobacteraceae bacterium]
MKKRIFTACLMVFALMLWTPVAWSGEAQTAANVEDVKQSAASALQQAKDAEVVTQAGKAVKDAAAETKEAASEAAEAGEGIAADAEEMMLEGQEAVEEAVEAAKEAVAPPPADPLDIAVDLIKEGTLESRKKALDICLEAVKKAPESYHANWMAARACREYANTVKRSERQGWEDVCKEYGKKGMNYAEKATQINPNGVEGFYWYGTSVGIYSDGTGIMTALKEGLKNKTQENFETAYKIDKLYSKGGPIIALGRFWYVLPWPLNDKGKSMEYFREFQKTEFYRHPETVEFNVYFAELLMDSRSTKDEAKALLEDVSKLSDDPYWNKRAKELLSNF